MMDKQKKIGLGIGAIIVIALGYLVASSSNPAVEAGKFSFWILLLLAILHIGKWLKKKL